MTQRRLTQGGPAHRKLARVITFAALLVWTAGCDDDVPPSSNVRGTVGTKPAPVVAATPTSSLSSEKFVLRDEDFVESDRNRDPFRGFAVTSAKGAVPEALVDPQRPVVMPDTNVEEMRLIAVVLGLARPKAMLTAPDGVGYVVQRGDYLGKAKVLQATGSVPMTLNWRVDRIREHEVVLTRQDPTDASHTPMSRVISMADTAAN